jgi:hypothetical protein
MREGYEGFCQSKSTATFVKRGLPKRSVARNSPVRHVAATRPRINKK